jgi:hypothetical protein
MADIVDLAEIRAARDKRLKDGPPELIPELIPAVTKPTKKRRLPSGVGRNRPAKRPAGRHIAAKSRVSRRRG